MTTGWRTAVRFDPIPRLLSARSVPIRYFSRRDLLGEDVGSIQQLWLLPEPRKILDSQQASGAWKYHGGREQIRPEEDYNQIETFRILRLLVENFGFNRESGAIERAASFLFSRQSGEGDFRGIAGHQYIPYYHAAIMELLIKSGFRNDSRIERGFEWLNSIRQNDGGWAFPLRTLRRKLDSETFRGPPLQPDRSKPYSHLVTGMVLRAFAADPSRRKSEEAQIGGRLLKSRFFKQDHYIDRKAASFWTSFSFPFWFNDLLSSLDSLSLLGFGRDDPDIGRGMDWFVKRQSKSGLWKLPLRIMAREPEPHAWISLAICRVLKRLQR